MSRLEVITRTAASEWHAIVLAAGAGRRFGGRKLLAQWRGAPLLHGALAAAFGAPVASVTVLTGSDAVEVGAVAISFAERSGDVDRLRIAHVRHHDEGMAAALRAGLAGLPHKARGCFIFLGDMPCIPISAASQLLAALGRSDALAAVPTHHGRRGHPVLVRRRLFRRFQKLSGDQGARRLLDLIGSQLVEVPIDSPGVLFDVDEVHQIALP